MGCVALGGRADKKTAGGGGGSYTRGPTKPGRAVIPARNIMVAALRKAITIRWNVPGKYEP